jgi:starch phosphorylase
MISGCEGITCPIDREHIAYFSMEVGISHTIPTYAGGLGVLAGDVLKSFADMKIPVVGVTLLNEKGYFYQSLDSEGNQVESPVQWNPHDFMVPLQNQVAVTVEGRQVRVRAWRHMVRGIGGNQLPVYFLDTNVPGNSEHDRTLTSSLYGDDRPYRLAQEIVLGVGGVRMLDSLGYHNIRKYHMNEGHASLLAVELLRKTFRDAGSEEKSYDLDAVREKCVFTSHTPVAAGHDKFDLELFRRLAQDYVPKVLLDKAIQDNQVNMTLLGLVVSKHVNGVAKSHGEVTRDMFPKYLIDTITNGIHLPSWASPSFHDLYDENLAGWELDPFSLRNALYIPLGKIWQAHEKEKQALVDLVNSKTGAGFHPARFTIGYGRRFTEYKRPDLLLYDVERLVRVSQGVGDIQVVFAGKAHPADHKGKELIRKVFRACKQVNARNTPLKMVFLPQYDMQLAKRMVAGCDVWLNTPQRPFEASGTSGMKAALNGVPHFSTLAGWWLEGHIENVTGWSIGEHPHEAKGKPDVDFSSDAADLYSKLEKTIIPAFYGDRPRWTEIMRHCIAINASFFNTYRMAQQYIVNAYLG